MEPISQSKKFLELCISWKKRDLCGGIEGETFVKTVNLCFEEAAYISLSKADVRGRSCYPCSLEEMLHPYLYREFRTGKWFAYSGGDPLTVMIYKAAPQTQEIILSCFQDIFLQKRGQIPKKKYEQIGTEFKYPSYLENLCFFTKKEMFFGTLSHEYICAAQCINERFESELLSLASWHESSTDRYAIEKFNIKTLPD